MPGFAWAWHPRTRAAALYRPPRRARIGRMGNSTLTALPVYNELRHVSAAVDGALAYSQEVLVVDDGSTDGTGAVLAARDDIHLITHPANRGYGAAVRSAFEFAVRRGDEILVTIDCDGQHQPQFIPRMIEACREADIASGSRYLRRFPGDSQPPEDRRRINRLLTGEINRRLGLRLTDAFCGFKGHRVSALRRLRLREEGYALPLEFWVQAARLGLSIVEVPVPRVYLDEARSFGGSLDRAEARLAVYRRVLERSLAEWGSPCPETRCAAAPA
jgi:glycosyltransferase involved in cell wall biosynthesis